MGEAMKKTAAHGSDGPRMFVNTIRPSMKTMRNAGEIEIIFRARLADRLKVILLD